MSQLCSPIMFLFCSPVLAVSLISLVGYTAGNTHTHTLNVCPHFDILRSNVGFERGQAGWRVYEEITEEGGKEEKV